MNPKELTPIELCDLPQNWVNHPLDGQENKYYKSCIRAWEVGEDRYQLALESAVCCQEVNGRYYIGLPA